MARAPVSDALTYDADARTPVAVSDTVNGWQIGVVLIGISITLPLLYSAGEVAQALGFDRAVQASAMGALILSFMSIPAAIVGAQTRLSSYMIIEHTFGYVGAKVINVAFGIFLLGWYAVTAELFGRTLFLAASDLTPLAWPEWMYTVASSVFVAITTVFGFRAIDRLALVAVPFLLLALIATVALSLDQVPLSALRDLRGSNAMDMPTAISAVVGAAIVGVVLTPDLTRYARTTRDCVIASFVGQGGGILIAYVAGMVPVLVWNELEPMSYMILMGFGMLALIVLVFATWTTNVINLYSAALAARASMPVGSYGAMVVVLGVIGTASALAGISDRLIDFLILLGLLVPPIAGVYLVDFFMLRRRDFSAEHLAARPALRGSAVFAAFASGAIAAAMYFADASFTQIGALDSLLLSVVLYFAIERLRMRWLKEVSA